MRIWRNLFGIILLAPGLLFSIPGHSAEEATPVEIPKNLTQEQVRDLVARLSDDQVRDLIIRELDKVAAAQAATEKDAGYIEQVRHGIQTTGHMLKLAFSSGNRFNDTYGVVWQQLTDNNRISRWLLLLQLVGLIVFGYAAYRFTKHLLRRATANPVEIASFGKRFDLACYGTAMGLIELGGFIIAAMIFVEMVSRQLPAAHFLWYEVIWFIAKVWLVMLITIQVMSPDVEKIRLVSVTNEQAKKVCLWALILSAVLLFPAGKAVIELGADEASGLLLRLLQSSVWILLLIWVVFRLRLYGSNLITGGRSEATGFAQSFARVWWILAIVYILLVFFMSIGKRFATGESSLTAALVSLALLALIPYLNAGLKRLIAYYYRDKPVEGETQVVADVEAAEAETPEYQILALRYARVLMVIAVIGIFLRLWNIDIEALAGAIVGDRIATVVYEIVLTVLLAWALWGVIRIAIERKLEAEKGPEAEEEEEAEAGGLGGTRLETVLPLIRISIKITIIIMAVLLSLSALGVNIGPLIAGAGVIGLAIGFGAQTLVRDVVSGLFYLIDDAFRIGEYVAIGEIRGTVEKISIRSFQLRHHNGPVHTIPYGDIASLTNYSRDWAIMKCELRLPFETDIEQVRKIIKKIGVAMLEDPQWGPLMLGPVKSQGVNRMDDSALIIRFKFMTIPGQQYLVRREAFMRIQRAFDENGIQFAPKRVLVEATTPETAALAAAAAAIEQEDENKVRPKDEP